jgi:hypothetical protein
MDLGSTTASATQAYNIASRFQPLAPALPPPGQGFTKLTQVPAPTAPGAPPVPPGAPPAPPANPPLLDVTGAGAVPAGGPTGQTGSALGPRYDAAGLPALPQPAPGAPPTPPAAPFTPPPGPTPTVAPPPTLAPANTVDLATTLNQTGPVNLATVSRATDLYNQIQQLVPAAPPPAAPPAPAPNPVQQAQPTAPSAAPTTPPTAVPTANAVHTSPVQDQQVGTVGISSLGGTAGSSTALLGFARGTFLNVLA